MSRAAKVARAYNIASHGKTSSTARVPSALKHSNTDHFVVRYDPSGGALGIMAKEVNLLAESNMHHPFHIRTKRLIESADPNKLHLTFKAPRKLSRSAFIRKHYCRKIKALFAEELREQGWHYDGSVQEKDGGLISTTRRPLKGDFLIMIKNEPATFTATTEALRACCSHAVRFVSWVQEWSLRARSTDK